MKTTNNRNLFYQELNKMIADPKILKLKDFSQHNGNTTFQHCVNVATVAFRMAEKLHWEIDEKELVRGAMLHDYYMYNIKEIGISDYRHGVSHPEAALRNAEKEFTLTDKEKNIITGHMWPLTLLHPPASKEALLVSMADKYCATKEMVLRKTTVKGA